MNEQPKYNLADILYGSYIRYDRLYEMSMYAFHGDVRKTGNNVNIFIDVYSIVKSLYRKGLNFQIDDSCAIASCIINLAIHLRAYFYSRHAVNSKVYIIYGGGRPDNVLSLIPEYNSKNILMEDSNQYLQSLIVDNLNVVGILCPYLYDIFFLADYKNEFSVIVNAIANKNADGISYNIIYSKEPLAYQLVAYIPKTFLYRPKKRMQEEYSWVVTKSTLYSSYRNGELNIKSIIDHHLGINLFNMYQSITGLRSRSMNSIKNANSTLISMSNLFKSGVLTDRDYTYSIINGIDMYQDIIGIDKCPFEYMVKRHIVTDLQYQTCLYIESPGSIKDLNSIEINLYDPDSVRNINDKYFKKYPIDLNRV